MLVEERLALSKYSSTSSKPTVTSLVNIASWAVSLMSVLSSKARLRTVVPVGALVSALVFDPLVAGSNQFRTVLAMSSSKK